MDEKKKIEFLFQRYLKNKCTPEQIKFLLQYFDTGENEELLRDLIHTQSEEVYITKNISDYSLLLDAAFSKIKKSITADKKTKSRLI